MIATGVCPHGRPSGGYCGECFGRYEVTSLRYAEPILPFYIVVRHHWLFGRQVLVTGPLAGHRWAEWPEGEPPAFWTSFGTYAEARARIQPRRWWQVWRSPQRVQQVRRYVRSGGILWPT